LAARLLVWKSFNHVKQALKLGLYSSYIGAHIYSDSDSYSLSLPKYIPLVWGKSARFGMGV
jgi:hypothetical protein